MFIRINPSEKKLYIFKGINKIRRHIEQSNQKLTEKFAKPSFIEKVSKRLSELEFEKHNSIKAKSLKWIVKKNTAIIIKMSDQKMRK